ncbi:hypothetical protein WN51_11905 [Melipona quadrifasciata]|uniref:Uncharacterized protein n=1 Tax=Melipona quadrifasciata TaxID=166423 RepID=A0A0M9A2W1_9HYME|nr:hypothetical protein WN51_11905 [Melipona quadrifasciata]
MSHHVLSNIGLLIFKRTGKVCPHSHFPVIKHLWCMDDTDSVFLEAKLSTRILNNLHISMICLKTQKQAGTRVTLMQTFEEFAPPRDETQTNPSQSPFHAQSLTVLDDVCTVVSLGRHAVNAGHGARAFLIAAIVLRKEGSMARITLRLGKSPRNITGNPSLRPMRNAYNSCNLLDGELWPRKRKLLYKLYRHKRSDSSKNLETLDTRKTLEISRNSPQTPESGENARKRPNDRPD